MGLGLDWQSQGFRSPVSGMKARSPMNTLRLAATGNPHGPSLYHLLEVLGKKETLARIERALAVIG